MTTNKPESRHDDKHYTTNIEDKVSASSPKTGLPVSGYKLTGTYLIWG